MNRDKPHVYAIKPIADREKGRASLNKLESVHRTFREGEVVLYAKGTSWVELAENVISDRTDRNAPYKHPIFLITSWHPTTIGIKTLAEKTLAFLIKESSSCTIDILSVSAGLDVDRLKTMALIRAYDIGQDGNYKRPRFEKLSGFLGEPRDKSIRDYVAPRILVPPGSRKYVTKKEKEEYERRREEQAKLIEMTDPGVPYLNKMNEYLPKLDFVACPGSDDMFYVMDQKTRRVYDLKTKDMQVGIITDYENFIDVFKTCMRYITENEKDSFYGVLEQIRRQGEDDGTDGIHEAKKDFFYAIEAYVKRTFIEKGKLPMEDKNALMEKLDRALFGFYVIQDLIDDPLVSDIRITDPYTIRPRIKGKALNSNIMFIDGEDYLRFVNGLVVKNGVEPQKNYKLMFPDDSHENYRLRVTMTTPYTTDSGYPHIHIRKIPRIKMTTEELIKEGMLTKDLVKYFDDRVLKRGGIGIGGPTGCGKTTFLNWLLDRYPFSDEIVVMQESPELFSERSDIAFEHVVTNPPRGMEPCGLDKLGRYALVGGCSVFIVGEVKGIEITHAIRLSTAGGKSALTIHCENSSEMIGKMLDYATVGMNPSEKEWAKGTLKCFHTLVYLEDFKVQEVKEIHGFDDKTREFIYRNAF